MSFSRLSPRRFNRSTSCFTPSAVLVVAWLCVSLAGCGREPFGYVHATGKITYDDGTPIPADRLDVTFVPQMEAKNAKEQPPKASASVDLPTGNVTALTSHKYNDGLVPGKHKIIVAAYDASGNASPAVPAEYAAVDKTPLEFDTAQKSFHLKISKPK